MEEEQNGNQSEQEKPSLEMMQITLTHMITDLLGKHIVEKNVFSESEIAGIGIAALVNSISLWLAKATKQKLLQSDEEMFSFLLKDIKELHGYYLKALNQEFGSNTVQ